ncbi:hypothetical protein M8C21_019039 [Ambrosia artemisiifolia]|uniref:RWP-RK domain-containing protein n=1 Tax=Ambrosia artemisiifolia TaxID=4212 RepID=A0AAD5BTQ6_AMBAR|nr:hypothetical protein M8C21_019039 [Ambrosia artemisiifolia]
MAAATSAANPPSTSNQTMAESGGIIPDHVTPLDPNYLQALENFLMNDDNNNNSSQQIDFSIDTSLVHDQPPVETFVDNIVFEEGFRTNPRSSVPDETNTRSGEFGNPIRLSSWPLQVPPYTCSCCQILREITHTNGVEISKFEIHGRLGVICHGVLEKYCIDFTTNRNHEYKKFDFCKESIRRVKQFLVEYCMKQKENAYIMLHDPLSSFYEAICVGLDWEDSPVVTDDLVRENSGGHHMNQTLPHVGSSRSARHVNKTTYSIQRERTKKLTIEDLVGYFHLPIEEAGKKIQICPTVIKKICRKHGLTRWPYRKIKSIEKKISMKTRYLTSMEGEERGRVQAEINTLQQEISDIYSRING